MKRKRRERDWCVFSLWCVACCWFLCVGFGCLSQVKTKTTIDDDDADWHIGCDDALCGERRERGKAKKVKLYRWELEIFRRRKVRRR